jgi:hypothetical protein
MSIPSPVEEIRHDAADLPHPPWCDGRHNPEYPVHTADVGVEDIPVSPDADLSVGLFQHGADEPQVWLLEHRRTDTAVTSLSAEQAAELGRRLMAAAALARGSQ